MAPEAIREKGLFPAAFLPLPHPKHAEGGMVFPEFHIKEIKKQEARDLTRFDLDFDLPDHFLPEFPAPIFLTTRPDLGDVSKGKLVTIDNFYELFNGILNPKQIEGVRLLVTPFPQQQFNQTEDRRSERPSRGVTCFDCHANGHTNAVDAPGGRHPAAGIPPPDRHAVPARREYPAPVRLAARAEDGRGLHRVRAARRLFRRRSGDRHQERRQSPRARQPGPRRWPNSRSSWTSRPRPSWASTASSTRAKATASEMRGQDLFFGKAKCASCHAAPYYTDNLMHNLQDERFFKPQMVNGRMANVRRPDQDLHRCAASRIRRPICTTAGC